MKRQLFIILVAFIISCNKKDNLLPKDKLIEKQKKIKFVDTISGIYKTEFDSPSNCTITLKISNRNGKYYYNLETSKRNLKGEIYFINDSSYLVLKGIRWDEYADADENKKKKPIGVPFLIFRDGLKLQNTGNSTNYYTVLGECETKSIRLIKK